jgi:hypothetical protein
MPADGGSADGHVLCARYLEHNTSNPQGFNRARHRHEGFGSREQVVVTFIAAQFSGAEWHCQQLAKAADLKGREAKS